VSQTGMPLFVKYIQTGMLIEVDARALGVILGVPATGFDLYVQEDKSLLGKAKLLALAQHLSQQPRLK